AYKDAADGRAGASARGVEVTKSCVGHGSSDRRGALTLSLAVVWVKRRSSRAELISSPKHTIDTAFGRRSRLSRRGRLGLRNAGRDPILPTGLSDILDGGAMEIDTTKLRGIVVVVGLGLAALKFVQVGSAGATGHLFVYDGLAVAG